jgi:hypothetical protein
VGCYFYSIENRLIDTTVSNFITIPTNMYPIETLIMDASNLMAVAAYWALARVNICDTVKRDSSQKKFMCTGKYIR